MGNNAGSVRLGFFENIMVSLSMHPPFLKECCEGKPTCLHWKVLNILYPVVLKSLFEGELPFLYVGM